MKKIAFLGMGVALLIFTAACSRHDDGDRMNMQEQGGGMQGGASPQMVQMEIVPANRVCMTQNDVYPREMIPVPHDGKTYYGCCEGCVKGIQDEPEKYIWAIDPISGGRVDKAKAVILSVNGKAVYFSSKENAEQFMAQHR